MLVRASVVVAIEAAAQLSDSTHIMLYSIRWEYRDTPGEDRMTGGSYCMHGAVTHSVSRVAQRMAGWRDSALPAEWVAAVTVAHPMSDSTLPHSIPMIRHWQQTAELEITMIVSLMQYHIFHINQSHFSYLMHTRSLYYSTIYPSYLILLLFHPSSHIIIGSSSTAIYINRY